MASPQQQQRNWGRPAPILFVYSPTSRSQAFVDQSRGLEGVTLRFAGHHHRCGLAQFLVNQWQQLIGGRRGPPCCTRSRITVNSLTT